MTYTSTYLNLSDDDVLSMTRRLYATPAPTDVRPLAPGVAPRRLSRVERFKLLMNEFQPICDLGCDASVVKFEGLVDLLRSTWKEVSQEVTLTLRPFSHRTAHTCIETRLTMCRDVLYPL